MVFSILTLLLAVANATAGRADLSDARSATKQSDAAPLIDPTRPVREITPTGFTVQWFTREPCETRLQIRQSDLPTTAWRPDDKKTDLWGGPGVRVINGPAGRRTFHVLTVTGLTPGKRYFYRLHDPGVKPTAQEKLWGAQPPWRREWAVSTQGGRGRKTIIRLPVKVLLMPNVINAASAHLENGTVIPPPSKMTDAELSRIREEYAITSRFFFVNSGMRYWVDFHIQIDDRWQRWGDEPANVNPAYRGWPVSRAYAGADFRPPGGGAFNIVDTKDTLRANNAPIYEERPFPAQIEQAFPRRWNDRTKQWDYYTSGGGTLGVDGFPRGVPGRSQYLGGGDTAWLAAHEFHHQMESQGAFSFANREDERIVFDHPTPRSKDNPWNTSGRHGEHWDVLAFWDRTLTDAQWLRIYFGETISVTDRDEDGIPDADPRLPLDEKRWGSDPAKPRTDGRLNDLDKVMLSTWTPAPLQYTFHKPPFQSFPPVPKTTDNDGDGLHDASDPYPLYPYPPFIWPLTATVDGDSREWEAVPVSGRMNEGGLSVDFRQGHDDAAYYAVFTIGGPWQRLSVSLDGEGRGVFSGAGVQGLVLTNSEDGPAVRPIWGGAPGLKWKASKMPDGATVFEFSLPNRGEGLWNWERGGREIGAAIEVTDAKNTVYSVYEPYRLFYATMIEPAGRPPLPADAPAELTPERATKVILPTDPALKFTGTGWKVENGRLTHTGEEESAAYIDGLNAGDFDLWMRFEAKQDAILGAFAPQTSPIGAGSDYIAFVGGYANTVTRLRLFGREAGDDDTRITPGVHTMQLTRRGGAVWCLYDGKPVLYAPDPNPKQVIDRLAVIGGYNGDQVIHEIRFRTEPPK